MRALLTLDDGSEIGYRDMRRFGTWLPLDPHELEPYLASRLGQEPLDEAFTPAGCARRCAAGGRR